VEHFDDTFRLADAPAAIAARLLDSCDELTHIAEARIAFVFSERTLYLHGGECAALISVPTYVQGPLKNFLVWLVVQFVAPKFDWLEPDYLVLVDRAHWDSLDEQRRERLIYHELCHLQPRETPQGAPMHDEEGRPKLKLVPHDTEIFHAELLRYGVVTCDADTLAQTIAQAGAEGESRRRSRFPRSA
jgi:hypothetical protein